MSPDETPVDPSEALLRIMDSDTGKYCFNARQPRAGEFIPAAGDTDGLSLYRRRGDGVAVGFMTPEDVLASSHNAAVRQHGGVIELLAGAVSSVRSEQPLFTPLVVKPAPDEQPGHVLIEQMRRSVYEDKPHGRDLVKDLAAKLARMAAVVIHPTPRPRKPSG